MTEHISEGAKPVTPTLTEAAGGYWASARFEDLPAETIRLAKGFLVDTLGAGIAGAQSEVVTVVLRAAQACVEGGSGSSVVWGRSQTLPAPYAAMVNGTAAHALELDDFGGCGHSGAVVVPVVCALGGRPGISGKDALVALVAGYDLAARVTEGAGGYRRHNELGWHSTGTCGSFGAAAAAARLLSLEAPGFIDALGIAGTFTGGIWAFLADGAMTKRFHPGKAAETGLSAALLAQAGLTGPRQVLDASWGGFYSTYCRETATPEATIKHLGEDFRIWRSGVKPYACCRGLHATIDALFELTTEAGVDSSGIAGMIVHGDNLARQRFDRMKIGNMLDAQFSMQYALAVAATSGRATQDQFWPLRTQEPEVKRLMASTQVVVDCELAEGEFPPLEIKFTDGRSMTRQVRHAKGAPENPLTDEEIYRKAESLITPVFGPARCREIINCVTTLERVRDFSDLTRLLAEHPARRD